MKLHVGNLRYSCAEADFKKFCENFGRVLSVSLPLDYEHDAGRGYGFVTFAEEGDWDCIIDRMNGLQFQGRVLRVALAYLRDEDH
jgi:RNA recognition motif-containing protein